MSVNYRTQRDMTAREQYPDDSELGGEPPQHIHYHQSKNSNGETGRLNTILLAALIAIIGFVGVKVWTLSESVARLETNVSTLLSRP